MRNKIDYVSEKLVKYEYRAFEENIFLELEPNICKKYSQLSYDSLLHPVTVSVWISLNVSLYLKSSLFKTLLPSFRQQICSIDDYINLLIGDHVPLKFFGMNNYLACYNKIFVLIREKNNFKKLKN